MLIFGVCKCFKATRFRTSQALKKELQWMMCLKMFTVFACSKCFNIWNQNGKHKSFIYKIYGNMLGNLWSRTNLQMNLSSNVKNFSSSSSASSDEVAQKHGQPPEQCDPAHVDAAGDSDDETLAAWFAKKSSGQPASAKNRIAAGKKRHQRKPPSIPGKRRRVSPECDARGWSRQTYVIA